MNRRSEESMARKHQGPAKAADRSTNPQISDRTRPAGERDREERREGTIEGAASEAKDRASELYERGKDALQELTEGASERAAAWASDAREVASSTVQRTQEVIGPMAESVRQNPWPVALIGAGLAWLVVDTIRGQENQGRRSGSSEPRVASTSRMGATTGSEAAQRVWRFVRQNPLLAGISAIGIGVAVGMALPETEQEDELLGEARDAVVGRAKELARGTVEAVQGAAESVQHLVGKS
jgi:ElaB/YqjD/DUF883 family membrane-anchored ribosome-binding protein